MNASDFANDSMRSSSPRFGAIDFASSFVWLYKWSLAFLYVLATLSLRSFMKCSAGTS